MANKSFHDLAQKSISQRDKHVTSDEEPLVYGGPSKAQLKGTTRLQNAREIPIGRIKPDPKQPRKTRDDAALAELATSIKEHGVLESITVEYIEDKDHFKIIYGERRYRAAQKAGLTHMPCIIRTTDKSERLALQLIENLQREDLSPIDKARGLLELKATLGADTRWTRVEKITGISERRRKQFVALLNLPKEIQKEIVSLGAKPARNQITEKHGRALVRLNKSPEKQLDLFNKIKNSKTTITGDEALQLVKEFLGSKSKTKHKILFSYIDLDDLIQQLEAKLAAIKTKQKRR